MLLVIQNPLRDFLLWVKRKFAKMWHFLSYNQRKHHPLGGVSFSGCGRHARLHPCKTTLSITFYPRMVKTWVSNLTFFLCDLLSQEVHLKAASCSFCQKISSRHLPQDTAHSSPYIDSSDYQNDGCHIHER